jgi:hypothetical protein
MKFKYDEILGIIEQALIEAGFSSEHIERISNNLSWKLRFTRQDAKHIEKKLRKRGLIDREKHYIVINHNRNKHIS